MNRLAFSFCGAALDALASGALWWAEKGLLVVSDLHFGKSARAARLGGATLPPYEGRETLTRLEADLAATGARQVICLGDSFDFPEMGAALPEDDMLWIARLQAGRDWVWIEGNHDPGPIGIGGSHRAEMAVGGLTFRHIAQPGARAEVSGHYHPKAFVTARGRRITRACFLRDGARLILPAYGAYTGGLRCDRAPLSGIMETGARAILTGRQPVEIPMPR